MKPIPGYEDYKVDTEGNVWSFKKFTEGKLLKPIDSGAGYIKYTLCKQGRQKMFFGHRLVASTYLGLDLNNSKIQVNHKDGVKTNNFLSNLELCMPFENTLHAMETGLIKPKSHLFLTENKVKEIKYLLVKSTLTYKEIADRFKVGHLTVTQIASGYSWKNVPFPDGFTEFSGRTLNKTQIAEISQLLIQGDLTYTAIGKLYGVTRSAITYHKNKLHIGD